MEDTARVVTRTKPFAVRLTEEEYRRTEKLIDTKTNSFTELYNALVEKVRAAEGTKGKGNSKVMVLTKYTLQQHLDSLKVIEDKLTRLLENGELSEPEALRDLEQSLSLELFLTQMFLRDSQVMEKLLVRINNEGQEDVDA